MGSARKHDRREIAPAPVEKSSLCRQEFVDAFGAIAFELVPVSRFLAPDAVFRPRYRFEPLRLDLFLAMEANSIATVSHSSQSTLHISKQVRFAVQVADRQLALASELYFIQSVR